MLSVDKIKGIKTRYEELYSEVRGEQVTDQSYYDDTFGVPEIKKPHRVWRSGIGARMIDAPSEQIVTSNPQVFFDILKGKQDISKKLSREVNSVWMQNIKKANPNLIKESVKNKQLRGESYVKVCHNDRWNTSPTGKDEDDLPVFSRIGLPIIFGVPDPMVIYGSPEEDDCGWFPNTGVPNNVLVWYKRQPSELIQKYPEWKNPENKERDVEWVEYWDKDTMYFAADNQVLVHAKNPYGFTPFARKFSGFGRRNANGSLSSLIVGDLRWSRDLIRQECVERSNIISREILSSHQPITIFTPGDISDKELDSLEFNEYVINVVRNIPEGTKIQDTTQMFQPPTAEMYKNLDNVRSELIQRNPFLVASLGSSSIHEDMLRTSAMKRYDTIIENTEEEWATAIAMGLHICKNVPYMKPDGLSENDLNTSYQVSVQLRAKDPIEEDRKFTLGERLWNNGQGSIDLKTLHMEFQGRTEDESEDIKVRQLVDRLTIYNPDVAAVMGMVFGEESGMLDWLEKAKSREGLESLPTKSATERLQGETQTVEGMRMGTQPNRGARMSPEGYERG